MDPCGYSGVSVGAVPTPLAFPCVACDLVAFLFWVFAAGNFTLASTQLYFTLSERIPAFLVAGVLPSPS